MTPLQQGCCITIFRIPFDLFQILPTAHVSFAVDNLKDAAVELFGIGLLLASADLLRLLCRGTYTAERQPSWPRSGVPCRAGMYVDHGGGGGESSLTRETPQDIN